MTNFWRKKAQKIILVFLIGIVFFNSISNVYAETLTINEVETGFNNSSIIKDINELGTNITTYIDSSNQNLDIYQDTEKILTFKYTDEYIEYDNRSTVITPEFVTEDIFTYIIIYGIMDSIFDLSGFENKTISENANYTYEEYGLELTTESYNLSGSSEDGNWYMNGEVIRYFKISLDTDKITTLMTKYGVDDSEEDPNKELINSLTPSLEAKDITENSVTLYPHIRYTNSDDTVYCYIYRSQSEDGEYTKISDMAVNCSGEIGFVDKELKKGTTYYYKTIVEGGTKYSDILKVTTKGSSISNSNENIPNNSSNESNNDEIKNPDTGVILPIFTIISGCILALLFLRKKSVIKKI